MQYLSKHFLPFSLSHKIPVSAMTVCLVEKYVYAKAIEKNVPKQDMIIHISVGNTIGGRIELNIIFLQVYPFHLKMLHRLQLFQPVWFDIPRSVRFCPF